MSSYIKDFQNCSFESRNADSSRLMNKYPDRVCVIVGKQDSSDIPDINKHKFLVPRGLTVGQFQYVIRKKIQCRPEQGVFMFINGKLPPNSTIIGQVYNENKNEDGYLYVIYAGENTFG